VERIQRGAMALEFWVSYGPMFFRSFKEWRRGRECLDELAEQRAFRGDNPYDKTPGEVNARVATLLEWIGSATIRPRTCGRSSVPAATRPSTPPIPFLSPTGPHGSKRKWTLQPLSLKRRAGCDCVYLALTAEEAQAAASGSRRPSRLHTDLLDGDG
jgi:hypothetical protein